ncbi:MAG: thioredoxin family protein [Actinomycetota bacterium]
MELVVRLLIVAAIVSLAWATGRSITRWFTAERSPNTFEAKDAGLVKGGPALIHFTTPYCHECQLAQPVLAAASKDHGMQLAHIDARDRPDLANKYKVRSTPTILLIDERGTVHRSWFKTPEVADLTAAMFAVA